MPDYEFHVEVAKVEERFAKRYDPEKAGAAKTDAQFADASEEISIGWFVTLAKFGVSFCFGRLKPEIEAGDTMIISFRKIPKAPPQLVVVPAPPPPMPPLTAEELAYIRARLADDAMHERGPEDLGLSASIREKLDQT